MHRTIRVIARACAAVAVAIAVGCGTREAVESSKSGGAPTPAGPPKSTPTVELAQVRYDALADALQKQKGNVVVIDMWDTY